MNRIVDEQGTFAAAQIIALLDEIERLGLNLTSARAFTYIGGMTMHPDNPKLPTISDVAAVVHLTMSGASRIVASLSKDHGLVVVEKGVEDPRSGAVSLTQQGKNAYQMLMGVLAENGEVPEIAFFDRVKYIEAKFHNRKGNFHIGMRSFDRSSMTMKVSPMVQELRAEVDAWIASFERDFCSIEEEDDHLLFHFAGLAEAIQFRLRWTGERNY